MRIITKKRVAAAAAAIVLAGGGMAAYAYFTTTGSGTGSGSTGTSSALTIHGTVGSTLYPGTSATVSFTVDNPSPGHQYVTSIHLASITTDAGHSGCVLTDYTMADVAANQSVANGNGIAITATGTLAMADNGNQDACKNAPLTLNFTSN
jgi:hypothetical protein